jgi:hypothetical protein
VTFLRKPRTQWLLAASLIVVGVIRLLLGTYVLGGIILGAGLIVLLIALRGRSS